MTMFIYVHLAKDDAIRLLSTRTNYIRCILGHNKICILAPYSSG